MSIVIKEAIVRVSIPSVITPPTIITSSDHFNDIPRCRLEVFFYRLVRRVSIKVPVTITSPKIRKPIITYLRCNIRRVISFCRVSSPNAFASISTNAKRIMGAIIASNSSYKRE